MEAIYARQSLDVKDSISIEMQIEKAIEAVSPGENYEVYADKGFSGKNTKRPEYKRLMEDIEQGKISKIIVYKLDRFSRSLKDFALAWDYLSQFNVEFFSINEKFDTSTPIGKAMIFIVMVFAQFERETIAERVTDNYYTRIKSGRWPGGPAPYGFSNGQALVQGKMLPTLIEAEQMSVVKRIFQIYATDPMVALGNIATILRKEQALNSQGIVHWNNVMLARILKNPAYVKADVDIYLYYKSLGVTINNDIEEFTGEYGCSLVGKRNSATRKRNNLSESTLSIGLWPGTIDSATWIACNQKLAVNQQIKNSGKGKYSWLSGLMKCGMCGRGIRVVPYRSLRDKTIKRLALVCSGHIDHICEHVVEYTADEIEHEVENELMHILEQCKEEPIENQETMNISNEAKIEIHKMEEQINNLLTCMSSGAVSDTTIFYINRLVEQLNEKQKALYEKSISRKKKLQIPKIDFLELDIEEKKMIAKTYIDKVMVFENYIEIIYKI